jgi:hypothetical protein
MSKLRIPLIFAFCHFAITNASGAVVVYNFSGSITEGGGNVTAGSTFSGEFVINLTQSPTSADPNGVSYSYESFNFELGPDLLQYAPFRGINVDNDGTFAGDRVDIDFLGGTLGGFEFSHGRFRLVDSTNNALYSNSLPFEIDLAKYSFHQIWFYAPGVNIIGEVQTLTATPVPEPTSALALVLGGGLWLKRRNRPAGRARGPVPFHRPAKR